VSHSPRCQTRDRRDSERQLMIGASRIDEAQFPFGVSKNRHCLVLVFVLVFGWAGLLNSSMKPALAQEASESENVEEVAEQRQEADGAGNRAAAASDSENANGQPANTKLWIPAVLPDGRRITPIGMYQSQMDELVPSDYHPVSLEQLNLAIAKWTARATDDQTSRLKGAVYWVRVVGDTLVSDKSILDIESDRTDQVRRSLGKVNLAIEQPRGFSPGNTTIPRMESESNGNLVAVFRGDEVPGSSSEIRYSWNMRGTKSASGYSFDLKIPRAPQAKFYFSMPSGTSLRTDQGVLRFRSGPPVEVTQVTEASELSDANESNWAVDIDWYELDAGGLDAVTIHTQVEPPNSAPGSFIIRRSEMLYEVDRRGLKWACKMAVQVPEAWQFPELFIGDATVTTIELGGEPLQFSTSDAAERKGYLQIKLSGDAVNEADKLLDLVVRGHSRWENAQGWCELSVPIWVGDSVAHATVVDEAILLVREPLRVQNWKLPENWQWVSHDSEANVTAVTVRGPAITSDFDPGTSNFKNNLIAKSRWSRVQLVNQAIFSESESTLQLNVVDGRLRAKARIEIKIDSDRVEPVRLLVQDGWLCESLTLQHSGRVIENPRIRAGEIVFWPENQDIKNTTILIEAEGSTDLIQESNVRRRAAKNPNRNLNSEKKNSTSGKVAGNEGKAGNRNPDTNRAMATRVPASWFLRSKQARGTVIAAVTPPKDLNWSGEVALQRGSFDPESLTKEQQSFFSGLSSETLWFEPASGRTPELLLLKPSVSFNAATSFDVRRLGDEVFETLEIEIQSDGLFRERLQVQTGSLEGRGEFLWSISDSGDGSTIGLPASDVSEIAGAYSIDLSERNLRGRKLIARRTYKTPVSIEMQLPIVSGASSQNAIATIGEGLLVSQKPPDVQRVPRRTSAWTSEEKRLEDGIVEDVNIVVDESDVGVTAIDGSTQLRYDAIQSSSITVRRSDVNPSVTIVWREQIRVEASSRGTDRIEATYLVSPTTPLIISYEPELQLESVLRDNKPVDLMSVQRRPLILEPRSDTETIRVVWNRSQYGPSWMRECNLPLIDVSGTVLKSEYRLVAASDTFAPIALIRGEQGGQGIAAVIAMQSGESTTLVRRNIALAMGWLLALLTFAVCWFIAERSPSLVAGVVVVFAGILFLWWPWKLAVIGWLIVPAITAGMLATSRHWLWFGQSDSDPSKREGGNLGGSMDMSHEFSLDAAAKILGLLIAISFFFSAVVVAQEEGPESLEKQPSTGSFTDANVLVPMDKNGKHLGSMVYIPGKLHSQLFQRVNRSEPKDARIAVADYRVNMQPDLVQAGMVDGLSIEADYLIHLEEGEQGINVVRIPIPFASIRTAKLLSDVNRVSRFAAGKDGWTIATLPAAGYVRIRFSLLATVSFNEPWVKVSVAIPPVASSRLVVQSEQNVSALRVAGRLLNETELRRWKEDLGPTQEMAIEFRTLQTAKMDVPRTLGRRYRVNAGRRQVTIECEVDPPGLIAEGETFQFDIRDAAMPRLTSGDWRLEGSQLKSSTRRQVILTCLLDDPGPIGLLWTLPPTMVDEQSGDSGEIQIPEVTATFGENGDAWLALYSDSNLQFNALDARTSDTFSVDDFNKRWRGFTEKINDRCYVISGELPSLILSERLKQPPTVSQQHDLKVLGDRLELTYHATLGPGTDLGQRYSLLLPENLELLQLTVNGEPLSIEPIVVRGRAEIPLPSLLQDASNDLTERQIDAVGVRRFNWRANNRLQHFVPPRITLTPEIETTDQYRISHDRSTSLVATDLPLPDLADSSGAFTEQSLAEGWIPEAFWEMPPGTRLNATSLGGRYSVTKRSDAFDCDQEIVLDRDAGGWRMAVQVKFLPGARPDFIDVEIPSRWCELNSLRVENSRLWTRQPSVDPSRQIIRIAPDFKNLNNKSVVIRGQLVGADSARVSVPSVRVLGRGKRRVMINVPSRFGDEKLQWREQAVKAMRTSPENRARYECQRPSWTVDLAPLPEVDVEPELFGVDVEVFPQSDGVLVLSHWDLFPGGLDSVVVELPPGTNLLAAWAAGRAVVAEPIGLPGRDEQARLVRVPLALTRLVQPIELLLDASASVARRGEYLPELKGIPHTERWVTHYGAGDRLDLNYKQPERLSERGLSLARAVVESVESLDRLSQRPTAEIAAWLQLWLKRYWMIAESSGHAVWFADERRLSDPVLQDTFELQRGTTVTIAEQKRWKELDTRMGVFVDRFLSKKEIAETREAKFFLFNVGGFGGFYPQTVVDLRESDSVPNVQVASESDSGLRNLIVNSITLAVIIALLSCIGPLQCYVAPVVRHPAFWLALVGIFGFAVAPVPVAGAILLVAISLPVFPSRRSSLAR
jgi:hypothetical protein